MLRFRFQEQRILDLDIENRPLSYWYDDSCTAEITSIAWSWEGEDKVSFRMLEPPPEHLRSLDMMLLAFCVAYNQADMVTGHYLRKHDLPIINGALLERHLPGLGPKLVSDTKMDLVRRGGIPASQEALAAMLGVSAPKIQMTQADWRAANRLSPDGQVKTAERVVGDVTQHKAMRAELIERGQLKGPQMWCP